MRGEIIMLKPQRLKLPKRSSVRIVKNCLRLMKIEFEDEQGLGQEGKLDRQQLIMQQINRTSQLACGDFSQNEYISAVEILEALIPICSTDKWYKDIMAKEKKIYLSYKTRINKDDSKENLKLDLEFYRMKFSFLIRLLDRNEMY